MHGPSCVQCVVSQMVLVQLCLIMNCKQGEGEPEAAILDVTVRLQTAESEAATAQQHVSAFEVICPSM
jgi:hypothetical protein